LEPFFRSGQDLFLSILAIILIFAVFTTIVTGPLISLVGAWWGLGIQTMVGGALILTGRKLFTGLGVLAVLASIFYALFVIW
jgi:hypothetical protein